MLNLDMIDTVGMGIRRMFQEQRKRYFPLPEYDVSDSNKVKLTIYGKILDENYSNVLFERADLSLSQVMALDRIQKKEKVDAAVVKELRKMGLIEGRIPKLYVSANIAAATENKAQYIKNRAFDDSYYEKLIVEFIEKYGFAARKDIDRLILAKLPEILGEKEKTNKVGNILSRMRRQGIIINIGTSRKPHWVKQERSNS